jgi:hypothetical protein
MTVESRWLLNSKFFLGDWYAKRLVELGYGMAEQGRAPIRFVPMTTPIARQVQLRALDPGCRTSGLWHRFDCITKGQGVLI